MKEIKDVEPSVLVLIVTAYGDEEVAVEAFRSGARDYLRKPYRKKNILPGAETPAQPGTPPSTVTLSQYHKIQQAVRYINDNYRTDIRLDAVAREAGMSPSHFSRIFKKVMGLSYQEYLNDRRITKAKNASPHQPPERNRNRRLARFCRSNRLRQNFQEADRPDAFRLQKPAPKVIFSKKA